ncbi:MAG: right-handed parallel beta-helix repeat-containing protein, partial [Saprospiraceae bacterium]|nr:right-handed parallel beta-helix repeat-containing protein [Saprospiraceae bacterium]
MAVWQANNLVIRGVGGRPHLEAGGQYIWGKGIWVLAGNGITVENIEFSGATVPDQNGAGIRLDGTGMTVRHCYFHHNQNGILTSNPYAGEILIEYTEFADSGYGDGYTHNVYIGHVDKLIFRYNYSHHAIVGHNLKSRAKENHILYNRIMDEVDGQSSRLI